MTNSFFFNNKLYIFVHRHSLNKIQLKKKGPKLFLKTNYILNNWSRFRHEENFPLRINFYALSKLFTSKCFDSSDKLERVQQLQTPTCWRLPTFIVPKNFTFDIEFRFYKHSFLGDYIFKTRITFFTENTCS